MSLSKERYRFHALLSRVGIMDQKANILAGYDVESTSDLTIEQLQEVNDRLRQMLDKKNEAPREVRKLRSKVLNLLTALNVFKDNNWTRVNEYLMQPRICGKLLYELNEEELKKLIRKLTAIRIKMEERLEEEKFWANNN